MRLKYLTLKREKSSSHKDKVELIPGSGLHIEKIKLEKMTFAARNECVLVRHLFRYFFTDEEIATHSLFGVKCNALKDQIPAPEIDSGKRTAIFGKNL